MYRYCFYILFLFAGITKCTCKHQHRPAFISYTLDPQQPYLRTYWKNNKGQKLITFENLASYIEARGSKIEFAMNCGMYTPEYNPVGLYIENGKQYSALKKCNTDKANFCLQPQGVFFLTIYKKAGIASVDTFSSKDVQFASQSAPILLINGVVNKDLPTGNRLKRNGIGIRKDGKVVMAVSQNEITFNDLADYFLSKGCITAMFFDGNISQAYYPEKGIAPGEGWFSGKFGVMIAVSK